jgi:hypothetical protein
MEIRLQVVLQAVATAHGVKAMLEKKILMNWVEIHSIYLSLPVKLIGGGCLPMCRPPNGATEFSDLRSNVLLKPKISHAALQLRPAIPLFV